MKSFFLLFYPAANFIFNFFLRKELTKTTYLQIIKHYFVGFIGAVLNYSIFNILKYFVFDTKVSNTITHGFLILTIFILQKYFTYKAKHNSIWQPIFFLIITVLYYIFDTIILLFLIDKLGIIPLISKLVSIIFLAPFSFLFQKFIVFRKFD